MWDLFRKVMPWLPIALFGAFGGIAPTLIKLATALVTHPEQPMPLYAFYIGLALYAVIGGVMAAALEEDNLRGALFAGIAAPALISSAITGSQPASAPSAAIAMMPSLLVNSANAAEPARTVITPQSASSNAVRSGQKTLIIQGGATDVPLTVNVCVFGNSQPANAAANSKCVQRQTMIAAPNAPQALGVPSDTRTVSIGGRDVRLNAGTQPTGLTVNSQPTLWQDFVWALGGARQAEITGIRTSPVPAR